MPDEGISESASENQPRRKRGRPRKWVDMQTNKPYAYEKQRQGFLDPTSERALQNRFYQERGTWALLKVITPDTVNRFRWLIGTVGLRTDGGTKKVVVPGVVSNPSLAALAPGLAKQIQRGVKASILTELGRIAEEGYDDSAELAVQLADQLCQAEPKLSVKEACHRLRAWRLNRPPNPANADELVDVIAEAIDAYFDEHVSTHEETAHLIDEALWRVMGWYEWVFEEDDISELASAKKEDTPC
jgi:hypothetical protein